VVVFFVFVVAAVLVLVARRRRNAGEDADHRNVVVLAVFWHSCTQQERAFC
jgi:heme/copper-type cytochrome/quinol oxidase subunit 3